MIYNTIKDVAANQGISIYRIEKDLEFPNGLISKWNKSTPSASNLAKVAKYLGVTTEKLLGDGQKGVRMEELKIREDGIYLNNQKLKGVQAIKTKSTAENNHATVYLKFIAKLI